MASRAGTRCIDLQFVQFHPTALFHPSGRFLISESLREEGARLVDNNGMEVMSEFHAHGSLAPRDVACARFYQRMRESGEPCVYLDISHRRLSRSASVSRELWSLPTAWYRNH